MCEKCGVCGFRFTLSGTLRRCGQQAIVRVRLVDRTSGIQLWCDEYRTGIEDIKSLSAMIVQSERFGTSLSQALKVYADSLRQRRRLRSEAAVAKAGIKMLFPIILFILPALFVITLVPGVLSVLRDLKGGIGNK